MILIDATTMWQCETCYWHGNTGCSSFIWCENGESYRPSMDKLKQVDAEPVRYGYWIAMSDFDGEYYYCSECGEELPRYSCTFPTPTKPFSLMKSVDKTNHCPNCGAKMY